MGKKNIIFYFSDQQRWDTVNEEVTPNLCELAKEGIKYENNLPARLRTGKGMPANRCLRYTMRLLLEWNSASK